MPFWEYIHLGRRQSHHNLQEGLFQIASQTCSILVQVNNTNNISYGDNSTNIHYNNFTSNGRSNSSSNEAATSNFTSSASSNRNSYRTSDLEQSVVLIPSTSSNSSQNGSKKNLFSQYKSRLTVSHYMWFFV